MSTPVKTGVTVPMQLDPLPVPETVLAFSEDDEGRRTAEVDVPLTALTRPELILLCERFRADALRVAGFEP